METTIATTHDSPTLVGSALWQALEQRAHRTEVAYCLTRFPVPGVEVPRTDVYVEKYEGAN